MKISNLSRIPQQVGIILSDGRKGTVRIMAQARRMGLPAGANVDPRWEAVNPGVIIKVADAPAVRPAATALEAQPITEAKASVVTSKE